MPVITNIEDLRRIAERRDLSARQLDLSRIKKILDDDISVALKESGWT